MKTSIQNWNTWWENPQNLKNFVGTEREFLADLMKTIGAKHIRDIIGVRRCGKTVLIYQIIQSLIKQGIEANRIAYLNFDDPVLNNLDEAINSTLQLNPNISHLFLDEVQNIAGWEKIIRVHYDRRKFERIFVSGSSAHLISRDIGRTLTGRHISTLMFPFSFREFLKHNKIEDPMRISEREKLIHFLESYIYNGGFPEVIGKDSLTAKRILVDLYNDILSRDIVSRFDADLSIVKKIGYYMMTSISSPFSYNSVAKALNLHYDTVKKYFPYFEESFLLFVIPQFSWKIKAQLKKDMKCYSIDNGLRNAVSFKFSDDLGKLVENTVLVELKRRGRDVYFWKEKKEVDFVVRDSSGLTAINVAFTDSPHKRETEGLIEFKDKHADTKLIIITKELEQTDDKEIRYIPLWKWLLS